MAIAAVAGLASLGGAALAGAVTSFAVGVGYFALGASMSAVSRALAPKPNLGVRMRGISQSTRNPAGSRKIIYGQIRAGGQVVFIDNSGDDNEFLHLVIAFATHEIESFEEFWFNDNKVWDGGSYQAGWGDYITITTFDGSQTAADSSLVADSSNWTNNHILNGIAYAHFKMQWDADQFPQGIPNISAVIKGKKVYDPRKDSTSSVYDSGLGVSTHRSNDSTTWQYSTNPALCIRDYLVDAKYGLGEDSSLIDLTALDAAADLSDEQVNLDPSGTQDRYQANGVIDTANAIKDNIEQLLSAMGGRLTYSSGKYYIDGAEYKTPTVTFTEADCISDIQTQTRQSRRNIYNGVKGIFVSEEKNYKVMDYPAQISSTYATEDGDPIFLDMPLPFVTNNTQAQRLAKIALLKSRQQVVINMAVNLKGLQVKVGDTIKVTNERLGYSEKVFDVIDYGLAINGEGSLGVNLQCIETASAVYDWTTGDQEDFLAGGELDLYDGRTVDNVTGFTLTEDSLLGPDGSLKSSVILNWTAPDDAFVDFYKIRYNENGTTTYFHVETKETNLTIQNLDRSGGKTYDFRIQVQNLLGVSSSGVTLSNQSLGGDTTAPDPVTNVSIESGLKYTATVTWDNPTNADFAYVQIYTDPNGAIKPADPIAKVNGTEYVYVPRSKAEYSTRRYFWLEAVDFSGNVSTTVGPVDEVILVPKSDEIDGDVSEIASVGIVTFPAHTVTSSATTFGEFTVPAPEDGVKKYGSLSGNLKYQVDTSVDTCLLVLDVQRESKGVTSGTEIGAIVASGTITQYYYYVEVSGNHVKEIDGYGGIATTQTSPSTIEKPLSVEYQVATDRTRVVYTSLTQSITTGTLYYNPDRWTSSGGYLSDGAGPYRPMIPTLGASTTVTMPVNLPLAKSDDDETYRVRVFHLLKSSGTLGLNQLTAQVFLIA